MPHNRILVIEPLPGIGDIIWHLPHLRALARDRRCTITLVTRKRSMANQIFDQDRDVNQIHFVKHQRGLWRLFSLIRLALRLRNTSFNEIWVFHNSWRYVLMARIIRSPRIIAFGTRKQKLLAYFPHSVDPKLHPIKKASELLSLNGLKPATGDLLALNSRSLHMLETTRKQYPQPWIGVAIGSSEPCKQWGAENFRSVIQGIVHLHPTTFFLFGGAAEASLADSIRATNPEYIVSCIDFHLQDVGLIMRHCNGVFGNDTGTLNLSIVLGLPTLGIFVDSSALPGAENLEQLIDPDRKRAPEVTQKLLERLD